MHFEQKGSCAVLPRYFFGEREAQVTRAVIDSVKMIQADVFGDIIKIVGY
jgi:hypothetical protein